MKKIMFCIAAAAVTLAACTKEADKNPQMNVKEGEPIELTVTLGSDIVESKATGVTADNEVKVNSLQVFVFRGDDLDAYGTAANATEVTISCTAGERTIYALVNAPDYSEISSMAVLKATVSKLSNNSLKSLEMVGSKVVSLPQAGKVSIDVKRVASRIVLKKVSRKLTSAALQKLGVTINALYLVNVAGSTSYDLTAATTLWHNDGKYNSELAALNYDALSASVAEGASYTTEHVFYCYPNDNAEQTTRLVMEMTIGPAKYYYPINMPALESNKSYIIEDLVITRPGSDDPDQPVSFADATFSVNVVDWTAVFVTEGTTI